MVREKIYRSLLLVALFCFQLSALAVSVKVDRNTIGMDETVTLTYEANKPGSIGANFSAISRDFNIIEQYQKASYSILSGRVTSSVVYTLVLKPLRTGTFTIRPVQFGNEKSASVVIKVKQRVVSRTPISGGEYFSEIIVTPENPYVQQETNMLLRIYSVQPLRMNRADVNVDKFNIPAKDALIKRFDTGKSFTRKVNGKIYNVYEYRYKLFPQHSGSFTIPALKTKLLRSYSRYRRYYGSGRRYYRRIRSISTKSKTVVVKPRPKAFKAPQWLPAVKVSLSDIWNGNPQQVVMGGSITRTITIEALGLMSAQLPEVNSVLPPGIKAYKEKAVTSDRRDVNHIRSTRKIRILFLPTRPGSFTIPEIKLHWWNVKTGKAEVSILPARILQVIAKPGQSSTRQATPQPKKPVTPLKPSTSSSPSQDKAIVVIKGYSIFWIWLSAFLLVAWIFTMLLWWHSMSNDNNDNSQNGEKRSGRKGPSLTAILNSEQTLQKMVRQSCERRQPESCRKALLDWSRLHWPKNFPTSLTQIGERLEDQSFSQEIDYLNEVLYASEQGSESSNEAVVPEWGGDDFWLAFVSALKRCQVQSEKGSSPLASLYPD